jgi:hypothetical protein
VCSHVCKSPRKRLKIHSEGFCQSSHSLFEDLLKDDGSLDEEGTESIIGESAETLSCAILRAKSTSHMNRWHLCSSLSNGAWSASSKRRKGLPASIHLGNLFSSMARSEATTMFPFFSGFIVRDFRPMIQVTVSIWFSGFMRVETNALPLY